MPPAAKAAASSSAAAPFADSSPSFSVLAAFAVSIALTAAAAAAPGLVPPNAHMLVLSLCIVHVGSHLSLCAAGGEAGGSERVSAGEAAQLPLVALAGLSALYAAFQFVSAAVLNVALRGYLAALGVAAVGELLRPLVPARLRAAARAGPQLRLSLPLLGRVRLTALDAALYAAGAAVAAAYLRTGHWAAKTEGRAG
jgi:hypothetical protein